MDTPARGWEKKNKQTTVSNEEQFVYCDNVLWSSGLVWWHSHSHSRSHSGLVSACGHTHSLGRLLSETVTTINMRPCQDYTHWDNQITLSHVTPQLIYYKSWGKCPSLESCIILLLCNIIYILIKNVFENVISINHSSNEKQAVQGWARDSLPLPSKTLMDKKYSHACKTIRRAGNGRKFHLT